MINNYISLIAENLRLEPNDLIYLMPVFLYIIVASKIDAEFMKIPNKLNYTMMSLRFLFMVYYPLEASHLLGFLIGGALILIPAMIILKPMGGDIKFSAALGLWVGDISILLTLILAVIMFLFYGIKIKKLDKKDSLAFAPFMTIGYIIIVIVGLII